MKSICPEYESHELLLGILQIPIFIENVRGWLISNSSSDWYEYRSQFADGQIVSSTLHTHIISHNWVLKKIRNTWSKFIQICFKSLSKKFVISLFVRKLVMKFITTIFYSIQWSCHNVMSKILRKFLYLRVIDISRPVLVLRMSLFEKIEIIDFFRNWLSESDR